jgi:hypothetical protein
MASLSKRFLDPDRERHFPFLTRDLYEVKSEETPVIRSHIVPSYNCIAFAAGDTTRWWEPDQAGQYFWPSHIPREYTVERCVEVFEWLGYEKCANATPESGFEKVSVYYTPVGNPWIPRGSPTHAALQMDNGIWKSKLGPWEDIEHLTLECLNGNDISGSIEPYGEPVQILKRRRTQTGSTSLS